ncbi:MAG: type II and III secretion system protein family protein [Planctomycetaceae bacterium]
MFDNAESLRSWINRSRTAAVDSQQHRNADGVIRLTGASRNDATADDRGLMRLGGIDVTPASASPYIAQRIDPEYEMQLQIGRPTILQLTQPPIRDQVADEGVVEMINITETELSLNGLAEGSTVVNFWFANPQHPDRPDVVSYLVRVLDDPERYYRREALLAELEREVNRAFPNSAIRLKYVGAQVLVQGQAKDIEEATNILRIVSSSLPNAAAAEAPFNPNEFYLAANDLGEVDETGWLEAIIRGDTATGVNSNRINRRIINQLQIGGVHQVMLKVTVAEVNRSAARSIGADLSVGGLDGVQFLTSLLGTPGAGASLIVNQGDFDLVLNALKNLNLARSLAEPTLTTLNGQSANFQVGGSFPIPVVTGQTATGLQGVEFQNFGVSLQFIPTVTDHDRVRLQLNAQVSTRDESAGTQIGTANVPGMNQRQFSNTVELRTGQTLVVAGLIQNSLGATSNRVPFLGDIPYAGRLFSNDRTSYDEQELIVLVTPYLAAPIEECERPPLPGSDYFEPTDWEFFVKGRLDGRRAEDFRSPVRDTRRRIKAYRHLEQRYIIGGVGHSSGRLCPPEAPAAANLDGSPLPDSTLPPTPGTFPGGRP